MVVQDFNILDYTEPIFRFCLNRLSSRTEAEDLSQEILLHILDGFSKREIDNPEAYVWQIAHNRYARKIDGRNKLRNREIFCGDIILHNIAGNIYAEDELILREEYAAVFSAVHSLSASYRDILVDYYVGEMYILEIAQKYNLTQTTVKWRLHTAKEKIKERVNNMNKTYKKIDWSVGCNGNFAPNQYLKTQIYKAIANACYEKPLDVEEISLATGIPTLYLEEPLEFMIYGDAIEQIGSKYATNFIILRADDNKKMQKKVLETIKDMPNKLWSIIEKNLPEIKKYLTYGADFPLEKLGYVLAPIAMSEIIERNTDENMRADYSAVKRKDGGCGWFLVSENREDLAVLGSGCNSYRNENDGLICHIFYYHFGKIFRQELNSYFNIQGFLPNYFEENGDYKFANYEELTAEILKHNIIFKDGAGYKSNIPVTAFENVQKIRGIFGTYADEFAPYLSEFINAIYQEYKRFVPERLNGQIKGVLGSRTYGVISLVIDELIKQGLLRNYAQDEICTDSVLFARN